MPPFEILEGTLCRNPSKESPKNLEIDSRKRRKRNRTPPQKENNNKMVVFYFWAVFEKRRGERGENKRRTTSAGDDSHGSSQIASVKLARTIDNRRKRTVNSRYDSLTKD